MGRVFHDKLAALLDLPHVGDVRGRGMLAGIELVLDRDSRTPFPRKARVAERFADAALLADKLVARRESSLPIRIDAVCINQADDAEKAVQIYDLMLRTRLLEERLITMYKQGEGYFWIGGPEIEVDGVTHSVTAGSGLEVRPGAAHQVDEHVFERGLSALPVMRTVGLLGFGEIDGAPVGALVATFQSGALAIGRSAYASNATAVADKTMEVYRALENKAIYLSAPAGGGSDVSGYPNGIPNSTSTWDSKHQADTAAYGSVTYYNYSTPASSPLPRRPAGRGAPRRARQWLLRWHTPIA